jgi:hypothetical protein
LLPSSGKDSTQSGRPLTQGYSVREGQHTIWRAPHTGLFCQGRTAHNLAGPSHTAIQSGKDSTQSGGPLTPGYSVREGPHTIWRAPHTGLFCHGRTAHNLAGPSHRAVLSRPATDNTNNAVSGDSHTQLHYELRPLRCSNCAPFDQHGHST